MDPSVANACEAHYSPLGPSDDVPSEPISVAVALADKIDTLTGFWAIDEKPTGSKDPFALRRAALGVIRLVLENGVRVSVSEWLVESALSLEKQIREPMQRELIAELVGKYESGQEIASHFRLAEDQDAIHAFDMIVSAPKQGVAVSRIWGFAEKLADAYIGHVRGVEWRNATMPAMDNLLAFFHDRLKVYLKDKGISHDVIDACLAMPGNDDLTLLVKRAEALQAFLQTDDGENLLQGYKRANNILRAEEKKDGVAYEGAPEAKYAEEAAERDLFTALEAASVTIGTALETEDIAGAMSGLAALREPIDAFFDGVQVNSDNAIVRRNRLCLLNEIREVMHKVAVFSALAG